MAAQKSAQVSTGLPVNGPAKTPFDDELLAHFRSLILDKRKRALDDITKMQAQIKDSRERSESDSAYSFHMADAGTDAMERGEAVSDAGSPKKIHWLFRPGP